MRLVPVDSHVKFEKVKQVAKKQEVASRPEDKIHAALEKHAGPAIKKDNKMSKLLKKFKESITRTNKETRSAVEEAEDVIAGSKSMAAAPSKAAAARGRPKKRSGKNGGDSDDDDGDKRCDFDQNFSGDEGLVSDDNKGGNSSDDIGLGDDDDDDKDLFAA